MEIPRELQNNNFDEEQQSIMPPRFNGKEESNEIGIIRELSPKRVREQIKMELRGYEYDYEENKWVLEKDSNGKVISKPLMNELGIRKYINCFSAITDTVTFSNFTSDKADAITKFIMRSTIPSIFVNYQNYGIEDKSDLPIIASKLFTLTHSAFLKAVGAGDRGVINRTISENIVTSRERNQAQQEQGRRGIFSSLNPFHR